MNYYREFKKNLFPKGVKRFFNNHKNKLINRTSENDFIKAFSKLGIADGSMIMIHAKLSSFGFLADGPESVINALIRLFPNSTIIMPTFPFGSTMLKYVELGGVFDPATTPSLSGLLSEAFRKMPGVKRSYHPTHSCCAIGPDADYLIGGSGKSFTPFGDDSPYGRYAGCENAYQLLLDTNSTSIVHYVQEQIHMPNLFIDEIKYAYSVDYEGKKRKLKMKVHTPRLPLYVALPGKSNTPQYLWMPDYCLQFPKSKKDSVYNWIENEKVKADLIERDTYFTMNKVFSQQKIKNASIIAIKVKPWIKKICSDISRTIEQNPDWYSPERIKI